MATEESAARQPDWADDPRPTETLIAGALENEEDATFVIILQFRGTQDVFDAAARLCQSPVARERGIGVWILGQLGVQPPTFVTESVDLLLAMLETEPDTEVLENIVVALGQRGDPRAIEPLVGLRSHPNAYVRYGVALGLQNYDDPRAIDALIQLSADVDSNVRDWATFGLGSIQDVDTPEVREALFARLQDDDEQVRAEAVTGLARRGDPRA